MIIVNICIVFGKDSPMAMLDILKASRQKKTTYKLYEVFHLD